MLPKYEFGLTGFKTFVSSATENPGTDPGFPFEGGELISSAVAL